jgi:hypothetical protein
MSIYRTAIYFLAAYRPRSREFCAITCAASILILGGCTTTIPRMNSNFNSQALGAPQQFPTPSPPNDQFIWLTQQPLSSVVASNPSGGNWVLTVPKPAFLADPDLLHQFLLASSEPFTTDPPPQMNGQFSIRLLGSGKVSFGIRATRGSVSHFVGAGELNTSPFGTAGVGIVLTPGVIDNLAAFASHDFPVIGLATFTPGQVVQFLFSLDQTSHAFNLSLGGGATGNRSTTYVYSGPIQVLELWLFLRQPAAGTQVFVNQVIMNEIK